MSESGCNATRSAEVSAPLPYVWGAMIAASLYPLIFFWAGYKWRRDEHRSKVAHEAQLNAHMQETRRLANTERNIA